MYRKGHIGLGLLAATPFAIVFSLIAAPHWGMITYGFAFITSSAPDIDQRLPIISHRGVTHTLWFGIIVSLFFALGTAVVISPLITGTGAVAGGSSLSTGLVSDSPMFTVAFVGCLAGFVSHLVGDIVTMAYDYTVNPFWPVVDTAYTLGWTTADSKLWNWGTIALWRGCDGRNTGSGLKCRAGMTRGVRQE